MEPSTYFFGFWFILFLVGNILAIALDYLHTKTILEGTKNFMYWVSLFSLGFAIALFFDFIVDPGSPIAWILLPVAFLLGMGLNYFIKYLGQINFIEIGQIEIRDIERALEKARTDARERPNDPLPILEESRLHLERYIVRNSGHVTRIFWITIFAISAGFLLVVCGVYLAVTGDDKLDPAILTTVAGVLTQFLGATFLVIFRSIMSQAGSIVETLERINAVGMSLKIVESIPDGQEKDRAKAELVLRILEKTR